MLAWIVSGVYAARVDTVSLTTACLPLPEPVVVVTPDAADEGRRFPSVYLLNGFTGDHTNWINTIRPDLPAMADRFGMVFVLPHGRDSWYWDSPADSTMRMETFFTKELIPYIDANYPTVPEAAMRAITGLSMGGHGALWLAMRHSGIWGNAGSMSGGVDIRPFPERWKMKQWLGPKAQFPERWDSYTVASLVPSLAPGQLNIIFDCGSEDFFAEVNAALHRALLDAGIPHDYTSRPGTHNVAYWRNAVLYHLLYFNEAFYKARSAK